MCKNLEPVIYSVVRKLYDERAASKRVPCVTIERDIKEVISSLVSETLTHMVRDGILQMSQNINGIRMFAPVNVEKIGDNDII